MRWLLLLVLSVSSLFAENRPWATPEGFFTEEVIERKLLAPGLEWITASGKIGSVPLQTQLLSVDLNLYSLKPLIGARLLPETAYFPRSRVSGLRAENDALAAINASFFDIKSSQSPLGLVMVNRRLLRSPEAMRPTIFFKENRAALTEAVHFDANLRVGEHQRRLDTVNASSLKGEEVGLYVSPWWQRTPGAGFVKEQPIIEIIAEENEWKSATTPGQSTRLRGTVIDVRENAPSRPLQKGEFVLASLLKESAFLRRAKAGDPVEIEWTLSNTPGDWTQWLSALAGNVILFREGVWEPQERKEARHPRTAVGINREGNRVLLVIVDGRSQQSVGAQINELGKYLHHLGAHEAINLDGGGSSAMSAIVDGKAQLLNQHSDRAERFVPTGLGVLAP